MPTSRTFDADFLFAESCLEGNGAAIKELKKLMAQNVVPVLLRAGASTGESDELVEDLISDLVVGTKDVPPILRRFTGLCPLRNWLVRVALNRWVDRQRLHIAPEELPPPENTVEAPPALRADDEPLISLLRDSIRAAMVERSPEDFVLFQMLHREGLRQTELARMFGCTRKSVALNAERIAQDIRGAIMDQLCARAPRLRLDWSDVVQICSAAGVDVIASK